VDQKIKILIVDDEERLLRVLRLGLNSEDFEVRTAANGQEALNELLTKTYDIAVTDLKMPVMKGYELVFEIERLEVQI